MTTRINEHTFDSTDADSRCTRCELEFKYASAWRTRCQPRRKPVPEPEAERANPYTWMGAPFSLTQIAELIAAYNRFLAAHD